MLTAAEALESALPSAHPASGPHPFAPSQEPPLEAGDMQEEDGSREVGELKMGEAEPVEAGAEAEAAALLASVGTAYSDVVRPGEAAAVRALLGAEHIFKCEVHA